ncbi:MAG TPA: hypothetical protein VEO01_20630 [Pseudonocardiaceae bacterium]|nr:hypothetical protein [Pseudonocardiaceae bacterium]
MSTPGRDGRGRALPDQPSDVPVPAELTEERNVVRRLEAQMAAEHGADTPAYWRAMSERLHAYLASPRFKSVAGPDSAQCDEAARRAYGWLVRVAAAYRALAATSVSS